MDCRENFKTRFFIAIVKNLRKKEKNMAEEFLVRIPSWSQDEAKRIAQRAGGTVHLLEKERDDSDDCFPL